MNVHNNSTPPDSDSLSAPYDRFSITRPVNNYSINRKNYALALWQEARLIPDTPAEVYLSSRCPFNSDAYDGQALRFHSACPFRLENGEMLLLPAMLGLMRNSQTNEPTAIHRTALQPDGSDKAKLNGLGNPQRLLGEARNSVVKLSSDDSVTTGLYLAEEIEAGLMFISMGFRPLWACLSSSGIAQFPILEGIEAITIFVGRNDSEVRQSAANRCGDRWTNAGREVRIIRTSIFDNPPDNEAT